MSYHKLVRGWLGLTLNKKRRKRIAKKKRIKWILIYRPEQYETFARRSLENLISLDLEEINNIIGSSLEEAMRRCRQQQNRIPDKLIERKHTNTDE